jgi:arsenate reductase-like glutaredoxin family protein
MKFYHYGVTERSREAVNLLHSIGVPFVSIDVKDEQISAQFSHDFNRVNLPLLLSDEGARVGYEDILSYLEALDTEG